MIKEEKILELSKLLKLNCAEFQIIINIFNKNENTEYKIKNIRSDLEIHHIIPKCANGGNDYDNCIYLSYDEHFIVHYYYWYLALNNEFKQKMACAFHKNFMKRYDSITSINEYNILEKSKLYAEIRKSAYEKLSHKVYCYETKQVYASIKEVNRIFKKDCAKGICKKGYGYLLGEDYVLYHFDFVENIDLTKTFEQPKQVYCYNNKTLYKNHFEARDKLGLDSALIKRCCDHKNKSTEGYYFSYADEIDKNFKIPNIPSINERKIYCKELNKMFIGYNEVMDYFNISKIKTRDCLYDHNKINNFYTLEYAEKYDIKIKDIKPKREKINWEAKCYNPYLDKFTDFKHMSYYLYDHKNLVPEGMNVSEFTKTFVIKEDKVQSIFDL